MKKIEVRITGLGGQGVVLAGQILGRAAVYDGKNVTQTQSYGAEARGSAAKSEIIISDDKIGYPEVRRCDILVAMNQEALDGHSKDLKDGGVLLVDSTYVKRMPETKVRMFGVSATENAEKMFGAKIYANMIILGALEEATDVVSENSMEKAIGEAVTKKDAETDIRAYKKGRELVHRFQK